MLARPPTNGGRIGSAQGALRDQRPVARVGCGLRSPGAELRRSGHPLPAWPATTSLQSGIAGAFTPAQDQFFDACGRQGWAARGPVGRGNRLMVRGPGTRAREAQDPAFRRPGLRQQEREAMGVALTTKRRTAVNVLRYLATVCCLANSACCCTLWLAHLCDVAMDARRHGPCAGRKCGAADFRPHR